MRSEQPFHKHKDKHTQVAQARWESAAGVRQGCCLGPFSRPPVLRSAGLHS